MEYSYYFSSIFYLLNLFNFMFKFKEFTDDLHIKQSELTDLLDYSQSSISKFSRGKAFLPDDKIKLLIEHYGKYITDDPPVVSQENISSSGNSTNYGHHNSVNNDNELISVINKQQDTIASLILRIEQSQQQISQLIELLNKK